MKNAEANIELKRENGVLRSVSVIMPVWNRFDDENKVFFVDIPMFGLKTFAKDENDSITAIEEALKCFCIASEKFGKGLDAELVSLGWALAENEQKSLLNYNIEGSNEVLEQIMQTGEQFAENDLAIA